MKKLRHRHTYSESLAFKQKSTFLKKKISESVPLCSQCVCRETVLQGQLQVLGMRLSLACDAERLEAGCL